LGRGVFSKVRNGKVLKKKAYENRVKRTSNGARGTADEILWKSPKPPDYEESHGKKARKNRVKTDSERNKKIV